LVVTSEEVTGNKRYTAILDAIFQEQTEQEKPKTKSEARGDFPALIKDPEFSDL